MAMRYGSSMASPGRCTGVDRRRRDNRVAVRQACDAIRDNPADPTWLAYTLYADPTATISTAPAAGT